MAIGYTGGTPDNGTGTTASVTHGLTINSGNEVFMAVNRNDDTAIDTPTGFTQILQFTPTGETARVALFKKVAGGSEPATYSTGLNASSAWQAHVRVYTVDQPLNINAAANSDTGTNGVADLIAGAVDGETISDGALSLLIAGKDNSGTVNYTGADNSYGNVIGDGNGRQTASAHRIYTTGETFSGNVTFTDDATPSPDFTYSMHVSFVEGAPARSITDIDTDNDVEPGQTGVVITTVSLDASPTTQTATLGGETITVTNWTATAVTVDIPADIDLQWGTATNQLALTDDTGTVTLDNVTLSIPTGWETVAYNGTAPDPGTTESFYEYAQTDTGLGGGGFTMAATDILAFESATGLTVDNQTIPVVDPPSTVTGGYKIWDVSIGTWTDESTYTITDGGDFGGGSDVPDNSLFLWFANIKGY